MKIFITGSTGYLGSRLARALLLNGHKLYLLVRESSNLSKISDIISNPLVNVYKGSDYIKFFKKNNIEIVLHCATHYGRNDTEPFNTITSNLLLPIALLDACNKTKVGAFINTGTMLDKRVSFYSLSKAQFDDWMLHYSSTVKCINVLLEHFYGPNDDPTKFVSYIVRELINNEKEIDLTYGEQERDFIYIDDVVSAFLVVIDHHRELDKMTTFQVGSGLSIKIRDFVLTAKECCNNSVTRLNFGAVPYRPNEVMKSNVDTTLLRNLGWECKTSLKAGLTKTIWG